MRAFAAVVILAACSLRSRALATNSSRDVTDLTDPVQRLIKCARDIGPSQCLSALAAYRAENALSTIKEQKVDFDFAKDIMKFRWEPYANISGDQVYARLCDDTEKLLRYRSLKFDMVPGYEFRLMSSGNGTLNVDVFNNNPADDARGMKKWRKQFYKIVPFLLLPGLFMSAVLPFVLPALKMMTVAVGMLNNMALSGAIFTLLRNNAFNDKYDKKIIYVNEGYHNEKHSKHHSHKPDNVIDFGTHESETHVSDFHGSGPGVDYDVVDERPIDSSNSEWINRYYGNKFIQIGRQDFKNGT